MKLSRAKAFTSIIFIAFCLLFSYQFLIFAQQPKTNIPAELQELLQGKSSDFSSAASQLKETDLPAALAVIELLKFKALHQEIPASADKINAFESQIKSKLAKSSVVSFSKTDTCCKKIEAKEIEIAGQKLVIPEYYIAEVSLAITGVIPTGEAGTVFPDIQINIFSQSALTEYGLFIDGKAIPNNKISIFKDSDELGLIFRPDLNTAGILSIGTHTAEISVTNSAGEKAEKQWSFTVGVKDISTPPLPEGTKVVKEMPVDPAIILPGGKINGNLSVIIYQDANGRRYTEYKLTRPSGGSVSSRNLAFIARKMDPAKQMRNDNLIIYPRIRHAFIGNNIKFSYGYSGLGELTSESWEINSNGIVFTSPEIVIHGNTSIKCAVTGQISTGPGDDDYYVFKEIARRTIRVLTIRTEISSYRSFIIGLPKPYTFDLKGWVYLDQLGINLADGASVLIDDETVETPAILSVNKLRWKIIESDCQPKIKDVAATETSIIFSDYGHAEVVFDVALTYSQDDYELKGSFEPQSSALYAFYPVEGRAELKKVYPGQLVNTRRSLTFKRIELKIKDQQRIIQNEAECNLQAPIKLCESILWPASSPLEIRAVIPIMATENPGKDEDDDSEDDEDDGDDINNPILEYISRFNFYTRPWPEPCQKQLSCYAMFLSWALPDNSEKSIESDYGISFISQLPPMTVFKAEDTLELKLEPSQPQNIPEGMEMEFKAALTPRPGLGEGMLSEAFPEITNFDVLDGYKISEFKGVEWLEDAAWLSDDDWDSGKIITKGKYSHIFKPIKGIGSYTMRCRFDFKLKESITDDSCPALPEAGVPVNALPDLRIFSPINKLVYPQGVSVKVSTTLDKDAKLWKQIKWTINGKIYEHGLEEPPFEIKLDREGEWLIEARLETTHPITGLPIPLSSRAKIEVQPLTIAFDPAKKVVEFKQNNGVPLKLTIKAGDYEAKIPKEPFLWHKSGQQAIVDSVEWAFFKEPDDCISADLNTLSLQKELVFSKPGAATVLATTTVRLADAKKLFQQEHKGFPNDVFEEPVFTFPAVRGDLWSVKISEITKIDKHFPEKSIAKAYRTYEVKSFEFDFESGTRSKRPHTYTAKDGLTEPILLKSALPGIEPLPASINFKWQVTSDKKIEQNLIEPTKMVIKPTEVCDYKVAAEVNLDFGCSALKLGEISVSANAVDLFSLIETKVDPGSFTVAVGEPKILKYVVSSLENNPPPIVSNPVTDVIYLFDNSYVVTIKKVEWSYNPSSSTSFKNSIESNPYEFSSNMPGKIKGEAKGKLEVEELKSLKTEDFDAVENFSGNVSEKPIQILINGKPLGSESYHMGQKVVLSYKVEPDNLENVVWSVENPLAYKSNMNSRIATHTVKNYAVETLKEEDLKKKQIEFFLYDFDPDKIVKNGSFTYQISGDEFVKEFKISYVKPVFTRPTLILPLGQDVDKGWDSVLKKWRFGFSDIARPGVYAEGQLVNNTEVNYMFGSYQLISVNAARTFIKFKDNIATNPPIIQQFLQTIKKTDYFGTAPKFWLDTTAPQDDEVQRAIVYPQGNSIIEIANDRPSIALDETIGRGGSLYYAGGSFVEEKFLVYVFAKPTDLTDIHSEDSDYYQSIWFPIAAYAWSWKGGVTYDLQNGWAVTGTNTVNLKEKSIASFSSWPDVAIGDSNPEWRDL